MQANVTFAKGQVAADPVNGIPSHDFSGLSRYTYNVVAFYEKYGFSLRLGYNSRDPFLSDPDIRGQGTSSAYGKHFSTLRKRHLFGSNSTGDRPTRHRALGRQ